MVAHLMVAGVMVAHLMVAGDGGRCDGGTSYDGRCDGGTSYGGWCYVRRRWHRAVALQFLMLLRLWPRGCQCSDDR